MLTPDQRSTDCGSVGPGWRAILSDLWNALDLLLFDSEWSVGQVKEKFGLLRVYIDVDPEIPDRRKEAVWALTDAAERKSALYCEACGTTEDVETSRGNPKGYWIRTLCANCRQEQPS